MLKGNKEVLLIASGDLRIAANQNCWATQNEMEQLLTKAIEKLGWTVKRAHQYNEVKKHGFIDSQKMGMEVFRNLDPEQPIIVAESVWQYSHHVLSGLTTHRGPILTVANWSGQWPGLVGMLNLNGSLSKAGVVYSSLWSETFEDEFFTSCLKEWFETGMIKHDQSHVKDYSLVKIPQREEQLGKEFANAFKNRKGIMGIFDEGCMGMYNAIVPDDLLHRTGFFKERLSQSALYAAMRKVSVDEAEEALNWLLEQGMTFEWGENPETELTREQTLEQLKMYIASLRIAEEFGCDTIGIQYQQGLKDLTAASDLTEGLLNNKLRPPVLSESGKEIYAGHALPHFNEVDECAGIDGYVTYHLWEQQGLDGSNTLHDLRWGKQRNVNGSDEFVWLFMISGAAPASHFEDGYAGATSVRQPSMFFPFGGGTLKGISKPGSIVWSRVFVMDNKLHCDLGVGEAVSLPLEETQKIWAETNPEWPAMHAVLHGVTRDQMMARHKANHIQVAYAPDAAKAQELCRLKAAAMTGLGIEVHFCGDVDFNGSQN